MIYDVNNAASAVVYDADSGQKISYVRSVDIDQACVVFYPYPLREAASGNDLITETLRFARIEVSGQGGTHPLRFDCYGRLATAGA